MTGNFRIVLLISAFLTISASQSTRQDVNIEENLVEIKTPREASRSNRDRRPASFEIEGKQYDIDFVQSDRNVYSRNIPVWIVKSKPGHSPNYTYELVPNSESLLNGHIYVDNAKKAVAFVHYDYETSQILYDGVVGENYNVRVIKSLTGQRSRSRGNAANHVIYKPKFQESIDILRQKRKFRAAIEGYLDKPLETLYPKILVVVDNHLFKKLGSDVKNTLMYVANFWSHVDQKYLEIDVPKFEILVTGLIIADDETALNYVYQSKMELEDEDTETPQADANVMYEKARLYFHYNFTDDTGFQNYDAAFVMTGLDTLTIAGLTMLTYICDNWYNAAIVRDDGSYSGSGTATHELAHLLSVQHDKLSYDGKCPAFTKEGGVSVMAPFHKETNNYFWSDCTKNYLREFAKKKAAECLATRYRERHYEKDPVYD